MMQIIIFIARIGEFLEPYCFGYTDPDFEIFFAVCDAFWGLDGNPNGF